MSKTWSRRDLLKLAAAAVAGGTALPLGLHFAARSGAGPAGVSGEGRGRVAGRGDGRGDGEPADGSREARGEPGPEREAASRGRGAADTADPDGLPPRVVAMEASRGRFRFDPVGLVLEPGDTVVWWAVSGLHTASAFHPDNAALLPDGVPRRVPPGSEAWHSGTLGLGDRVLFEHTFRMPGVHDYFCQPHLGAGMVGRVVVGDGSGSGSAFPPLPARIEEAFPPPERLLGPAGRRGEWRARIHGLRRLARSGREVGGPALRLAAAARGDDALARGYDGGPAHDSLLRALEELERAAARVERGGDRRALEEASGVVLGALAPGR